MRIKDKNTCPYADYCGGCQMQGIPYAQQLNKKEARMNQLLGRFHSVNPILGMQDPYHYRNKINASFAYVDHRVICGNYVESTHMIVESKDCQINDEKANEIIESIRVLAQKYRISIFNEDTLKGGLRHVMIRVSSSGEIMVVLICGSMSVMHLDELVKELKKKYPEITTVVLNQNNRHTSMVLGNQTKTLYGKGYITDQLCGLDFRVSPKSFFQVNKRQTEALYNTAIRMAHFEGKETLIDAYCGTGTIGLLCAKHVKEVIGVELNKDAIKDAVINAKNNRVDNIRFVADDAGNFMRSLVREKKKIDAVILDPPRKGADRKFLDALLTLSPKKVVYISCGPESLKENLAYLTKRGYQIREIQPVDMFPFTNHIETVVLLSRTGEKPR